MSLGGNVVLEAGTIENPEFENARICTPTIIEVDATQVDNAKAEFEKIEHEMPDSESENK